jgi:hypothetical protein
MPNSPNRFIWSELLVAVAIFSVGIAVGAYCFNFQTDSPAKPIKHQKSVGTSASPRDENSTDKSPIEVAGFQGIPSGVEVIKALADQRQKKRIPAPYDGSIRAIATNAMSSSGKVSALFNLSDSLPLAGKSKAYATIVALAKGRDFQDLLVPRIWNPKTPTDLSYSLATSLLLQPDAVKLPYALQFLQHPNEDIGFLGYSLLWSYFPNEADNNYAVAVQRFLANPRAGR